MTPSFLTPERNPMTSLEEKLDRLNLKAMSRQAEATIADAAARNLSVSATLELLADMELEVRHSHRAPLQVLASSVAAQHRRFSLPSPQEPHAGQDSHPASARSHLPETGHQSRADWQSRRGQDFPRPRLRMEGLSGESARGVHHRHGHAQSPARFAGRSFAGAQTEDLHRAHTAHR